MTAIRARPPKPAATPAQLQAALSALQTAAHILAGLAHRNKNQHRATKWWAPFAMLRRSLRKLVIDLEAVMQRAEVVPPPPAGKRNKTTATGSSKAAKQPELARVVERAVWFRDAWEGRAYEAFTQLTADRQFAPLGLVLIGVLAQVDAAIAPFIPPEPASQSEEDAAPARAETGARARGAAVPRATDLDLGVAVSRDELRAGGNDDDGRLSDEPSASPALKFSHAQQQPRGPDSTEDSTLDNKRRKSLAAEGKSASITGSNTHPRKRGISKDSDDGGSLPKEETKDAMSIASKKQRKLQSPQGTGSQTEKMAKPRTAQITQEAKKARIKKRKKGGDEFDDLFSSLL